MEQSTFFEICGWMASITMILGYLPQAIHTMRTRDTNRITTICCIIIFGIKVYNDYFKKKKA